ncbi:hypothetical protein FOL47_010430 [Perkinsus chesapeaki]|uniref:Uncharacterized protein n=1 Tax=Perkinsus chesapeaki TaxID=330153 RepID=A0A7J6L1W5_PERCH|nr:hypothetical protein FOL47_010430 [Perkinsus chesapeaki]
MSVLDVPQVVCWCKSLAPAIGSDMAKKVSEYVARKQLDGDHLAEVLRLPQDFISDAQIDGLTMIPANKVRKAWFKEASSRESCSAREHSPICDSPAKASETENLEPSYSLPSLSSTAPPGLSMEDACPSSSESLVSLTLVNHDTAENRVGLGSSSQVQPARRVLTDGTKSTDKLVPPPSRAPPLPVSRRASTICFERPALHREASAQSRLHFDSISSVSSHPSGEQNLTAMLWLQAVIDRLASKANLDRRSAYREIEDLLPEWMWTQLWGAVERTAPKRDPSTKCGSSDGERTIGRSSEIHSSLATTPDSLPVILDSEEHECLASSEDSEALVESHPPPSGGPMKRRKRLAPKAPSREVSKDALAGMEILRMAMAGIDMPSSRSLAHDAGLARQMMTAKRPLAAASRLKGARKSSPRAGGPRGRPSMIDTKSPPMCRPSIGGDKSPEQLAEWIRTLPSTQIPSPKLSELADTILCNGIDGSQMSSSAGLRDLGICNPLESRKLDRFWQNVLAETQAAKFARDNAVQIRTGGVQVAL